MVDVSGPEDPKAFDLLNTVERLRDPSHTYSQTPTRWQEAYRAAGLLLERLTVTRHPFRITKDWRDRTDTPQEKRQEIERLLREASESGYPGLGVGQNEDGTWFIGNYQIQILGSKL